MVMYRLAKEYKIALTLLFISILGFIAKYAFNVLLANNMGVHIYGDLILSVKLLTVAANIILLGTNTSAKRYLPSYMVSEDAKNFNDYINWNFKLILKSCLVFVAIMLLLGVIIFSLHLLHLKTYHSYHLSIYMLCLSPLLAASMLISSYLNCNKNYYLSQIMYQPLRYFLFMAVFSAGIFLFYYTLDNVKIVVGFFICFIVLVALEFFTVKQVLPQFRNLTISRTSSIGLEKIKKWKFTAFSLVSNNLIYLILCVGDLIIIELFSPHESSVGHYAAILAITGMLWIAPRSVLQFIKPNVSELCDSGDRKKLQKLLNISTGLILGVNTFILVIIIVFHAQILMHFGKGFLVCTKPLIVLGIFILIGYGKMPAAILLAYSGNEKTLIYTSVLELTILVVLGIILVHYYNILGVAIASGADIFFMSLVMRFIVKRKLGLRATIV